MSTVPIDALELALPRFLRRCDAESTREAYERELVRFLEWARGRPTDEVLFDYRDHLRDRELGPTTVRWRTTVVRALLLFARDRRYVDVDLVEDFRPPRGKSGFAPRVLSEAELRTLLNAPDRRTTRGRRDAAILACLGIGGLRAGEVCRLNRGDVVSRSEDVTLVVAGKGRKERRVLLPAEHAAFVGVYLARWSEPAPENAPLFRCGRAGREAKRLTIAALDYMIRFHARVAGLRPIGAHSLRHTAATRALEAGTPIHWVRDMLGHSSVLVTSRYLHRS